MKPTATTLPRSSRRHGALALATLLAVTLLAAGGATAREAARSERPQHTFAGTPLTQERAARIAFAAGVELIDAHPCPRGGDGCTLLAVRGEGGEASIYELSAEACDPAATPGASKPPRRRRRARGASPVAATPACFGDLKVVRQIDGRKGGGRPSTSTAKLSAAPGEDGLPPDPQDEAQADATNEIIEALGDGKYEGDYDAFWRDLESIQSWDMPSWREPDPPPPDTIEGQPLPSALDDCRPERRALERNESRCDKPSLASVDGGGATCGADLLPSFTPATDNLLISNWDWSLGRFVYFDPNHPDPTPEDVDLLVASWNFLVEHKDIAEWVICLVEGPSNGNCIERRLDGRTTQPFEFVDQLPIGCPRNAGMCTAFIGTKTSILLSSWRRNRDTFYAAGQTDTEKLCVVARLASVLLHEMLHSCLAVFTQNADDFGLGPGDCGCDTPDMAEAAFAWAIAQRYPCLAASQGCDFFGDDDMWLTPCDFGYNCAPLCE